MQKNHTHTFHINRVILLGLLAGSILAGCNNSGKKSDNTSMQTDTTQIKTDTMADNKSADTTAAPTAKAADTAATKVSTIKPLTVVIDNLGSETAPVEVSIYSAQNKFPSPKDQLKVFRFTPKGKTLTATLPGITYGEYAIAAYQDMDGDGKIATNMIGIPTDPYGFSKDYHPKVKAPSFKDCSFNYDQNSNTVTFAMIRKKD